MQPKPEHDLHQSDAVTEEDMGKQVLSLTLHWQSEMLWYHRAPEVSFSRRDQTCDVLMELNQKGKKKSVDYTDSSLCSNSYRVWTLQTRRGRDGLLQFIWSKDSEFSHSRTTGNEQVPEIQVRNEDCEKGEGAFIFASLFHQGLTC